MTRFSHGVFASLKDDHECRECNGTPARNRYAWLDKVIKQEIMVYGMNGIPALTGYYMSDVSYTQRTPGTVPMLP